MSFILGIGAYFAKSELVVALLYTLFLIFLVIRQIVSYKFILVWVLVFYFGFFNAFFRISDTDELVFRAPANVELVGRLTSIPNSNISNKTKFFFDVISVGEQDVRAKTFVNITNYSDDFSLFKVGEVYKISGKLRVPTKATNPSQFDYGEYLKNFDVHTVVYAEKSDCILLETKLPLKWRVLQGLNEFRNDIINVHSKYLKSPNLEILGGIVFGDDAVAPPDYIKDSFINSGLLHILAASGMNVAFIFGFWFYLLSILKVPYRVRIISGICVIAIYTLMTGLGASVIRASLMLVFVLLGKLIDRDSHGVALLSFVAFLMLLYNPAYLNDVGFQLSFIVTFGLLCTATILSEKFKGSKLKEFVSGALLVPVVAQIWVIPVQMYYFNTISLYSFLANIAILPFLSVVSFGGFISSIIAKVPFLGDFICLVFDYILNICLNCLVSISNFFSSLPMSLLELAHPELWQVILYYVVILLVTLMIKLGFERKTSLLVGMFSLVILLGFIHIPNNKLEVIMFDVGNADSFLVKTPKERYILIDTGKKPFLSGNSQAEMVIRKYLKDIGIKNLELLIITHFDSDHAGGAVDIIKKMDIGTVYVNSVEDNSKLANDIYTIAVKKDVNLAKAQDDKVVYEENDLILKTFQKYNKDDNESSVLTLLSYKNFDILFTGDAGVKPFRRIKSKMPSKVEVLKVGHHGAKGVVDNNYVNSLNADVSLVSVGKNTYGHPDKDTLAFLSNTDVFRTDEVGAVKIVSDGKIYSTYTFSTGKRKFEFVMDKTAE